MKRLLYSLLIFTILVSSCVTFMVRPTYAQLPTATVTAPTRSVVLGSGTATVDITVSGAVSLVNFDLSVTYNPSVVRVANTSDVTLGAFMASTGRAVSQYGPVVDNTAGRVTMGAGSVGSQAAPSGNGTLVRIVFTPVAGGNSPLQLQNVALGSGTTNFTEQPNTTVNGSVTVTVQSSPNPTPSASPVASPSGAASPQPGVATFNLSVTLEGVDQTTENQSASLWFKRTSDNFVYQSLANPIGNAGSATHVYTNTQPITVNNFLAGTYEVFVRGPYHLVKSFGALSLTPGSNPNPLAFQDTALLAADSDGNNTINQQDYNRLISSFRCNKASATPPAGKDCSSYAADADLDGEVSIYDYSYLIVNFTKNGDVPPQPSI